MGCTIGGVNNAIVRYHKGRLLLDKISWIQTKLSIIQLRGQEAEEAICHIQPNKAIETLHKQNVAIRQLQVYFEKMEKKA